MAENAILITGSFFRERPVPKALDACKKQR
jgi:hypothetical protein